MPGIASDSGLGLIDCWRQRREAGTTATTQRDPVPLPPSPSPGTARVSPEPDEGLERVRYFMLDLVSWRYEKRVANSYAIGEGVARMAAHDPQRSFGTPSNQRLLRGYRPGGAASQRTSCDARNRHKSGHSTECLRATGTVRFGARAGTSMRSSRWQPNAPGVRHESPPRSEATRHARTTPVGNDNCVLAVV
jgi:hypothetical protein